MTTFICQFLPSTNYCLKTLESIWLARFVFVWSFSYLFCLFDDFREQDGFVHRCWLVLNESAFTKGKKTNGKQRGCVRQTKKKNIYTQI